MKDESTKLIELLNDMTAEYNEAIKRFNATSEELALDLLALEDEVLAEYAMCTSYIEDLVYENDENVRIDANTFFYVRHVRDAYYDALKSLAVMRYNEVCLKEKMREC